MAARHFQHRLQLRELGLAQTLFGAEAGLVCREQRAQPAKALQQVARKVHGTHAGHAGAQKDGQQFGIREGARAVRQQAFSRTLVGGPVGDRHAVLL